MVKIIKTVSPGFALMKHLNANLVLALKPIAAHTFFEYMSRNTLKLIMDLKRNNTLRNINARRKSESK